MMWLSKHRRGPWNYFLYRNKREAYLIKGEEKIGPMLNRAGDLVRVGKDKAEVFNIFFASVINKVLHTFLLN